MCLRQSASNVPLQFTGHISMRNLCHERKFGLFGRSRVIGNFKSTWTVTALGTDRLFFLAPTTRADVGRKDFRVLIEHSGYILWARQNFKSRLDMRRDFGQVSPAQFHEIASRRSLAPEG